METPTQSEMVARLGISQAYASMILSGERTPSRPLAIRILREFDWRHTILDGLTDEQIAVLESVEPWTHRANAA